MILWPEKAAIHKIADCGFFCRWVYNKIYIYIYNLERIDIWPNISVKYYITYKFLNWFAFLGSSLKAQILSFGVRFLLNNSPVFLRVCNPATTFYNEYKDKNNNKNNVSLFIYSIVLLISFKLKLWKCILKFLQTKWI